MKKTRCREAMALLVTFWVLVISTFLTSLLLMVRSQITLRATHQRNKEALLRGCRSAASSALAMIGVASDEAHHALLDSVRQAVQDQRPVETSLDSSELDGLPRLLDRSSLKISARVGVHIEPAATMKVNPWEGGGIVQVGGQIASNDSWRQFQGRISFRLALETPPRPFDRMLLLVRDPLPLFGPRGSDDANAIMDGSEKGLEWIRSSALPLLQAQISHHLAGELEPELAGGLRAVQQTLHRLATDPMVTQPPRPWRLPAEASVFLVSDETGSIELDLLTGIPARLRNASRRIQDKALELSELAPRLWQDSRQLDLLRQYVRAIEDLALAMIERLSIYWDVEDRFVWRGGEACRQLDTYWEQLTPGSLRARAHRTLVAEDPMRALRLLGESAKVSGGRLSGLIFMNCPGGVLRLHGKLDNVGRLVVATDDAVEVKDLASSPGLLTVITTGDLHVSERVEAFLLAAGRCRVEDDSVIVGGLAVNFLVGQEGGRSALRRRLDASYLSWDPSVPSGTLDPMALRLVLDPHGVGMRMDIRD